MKGNSFEKIAKWIGHSHVSTTFGFYGHLSAQELQDNMVGLDWLGSDRQTPSVVQEWKKLTKFLYAPYTFPEHMWPSATVQEKKD